MTREQKKRTHRRAGDDVRVQQRQIGRGDGHFGVGEDSEASRIEDADVLSNGTEISLARENRNEVGDEGRCRVAGDLLQRDVRRVNVSDETGESGVLLGDRRRLILACALMLQSHSSRERKASAPSGPTVLPGCSQSKLILSPPLRMGVVVLVEMAALLPSRIKLGREPSSRVTLRAG